MVELNLKQIVEELEEYFPGLEEIKVQDNTITLTGDVDDFENFIIELHNKLPGEYYFENKLKGEQYSQCEIIVKS